MTCIVSFCVQCSEAPWEELCRQKSREKGIGREGSSIAGRHACDPFSRGENEGQGLALAVYLGHQAAWSAMTPTEEETWDRHGVDLQVSQSCVESVTLLGTLIASIWGGGHGVLAVWHRWVGLDNPESHWDFNSASWRTVGFVLSVLHGLAGVTEGATDAWDRCVALS